MPKTRRLLTNFSKGELSPLIEGRPDLALYFEGASKLENFLLLRQGGLNRRPGTRYVTTAKIKPILVPFVFSTSDAIVVEVGDLYMRFFKNGMAIKSAGVPIEINSPYTEAQLSELKWTQSADILFFFHPDVQQHILKRISDTTWILEALEFNPPPSIVIDTSISAGTATLTPGAISGDSIIFTASAAVFLEADIGRIIHDHVSGATAEIVAFGASAGDTASPNDQVRCDILDVFPNTNAIPADKWFLHLSPFSALDPNKKEPLDAVVTITADKPTFRTADIGKFIKILGGLVEITKRASATSIEGTLLSLLSDATSADPPAQPAGSWSLEENAWSTTHGFPRCGEFFQGRLGQASTKDQPTSWWLSVPDDFGNYAVGSFADDAVEYLVASRQVNSIEWIADAVDLFLGTSGTEMRVTAGRVSEPIGGDNIPLVEKVSANGASPILPIVVGRTVLFVDRSLRRVQSISYSLESDAFSTAEITGISEHILEPTAAQTAMGHAVNLDQQLYIVRSDGQLVVLTFFPQERVVGFTRLVTDGKFKAVAVIPQGLGKNDQVWVVVERTIGGIAVRYIEFFATDVLEFTGKRVWTALQTDSAIVLAPLSATTVVTGLDHLNNKTIDIVTDGSYRGTKVVANGQITLDDAASSDIEVGLPYDSTCVTMRPAVPDVVIEGVPRSWDTTWARFRDTIGGEITDKLIQYIPSDLDTLGLFTGDKKVGGTGWSLDGRVTVAQKQPYPMTLLSIFGTLSIAEHD